MNNIELEWGCPNGTKYPPRQPIPNRAILPNRARVYRRTDGRTGWFQYTPPNFVAGGIIREYPTFIHLLWLFISIDIWFSFNLQSLIIMHFIVLSPSHLQDYEYQLMDAIKQCVRYINPQLTSRCCILMSIYNRNRGMIVQEEERAGVISYDKVGQASPIVARHTQRYSGIFTITNWHGQCHLRSTLIGW